MASSTGWGPWVYTVYTAPGGWKPIRNSQRRWHKVWSGEATLPRVTGAQAYAPLPMSEEGVHVAAGAKQAFYVHCPSHATAVAFAASPQDAEGKSIRDVRAMPANPLARFHPAGRDSVPSRERTSVIVERCSSACEGRWVCVYMYIYIHLYTHMCVRVPLLSDTARLDVPLAQGCVVDTDKKVSIGTGAKTCSPSPFESVATDSVRAFAGIIEYVLWCEA